MDAADARRHLRLAVPERVALWRDGRSIAALLVFFSRNVHTVGGDAGHLSKPVGLLKTSPMLAPFNFSGISTAISGSHTDAHLGTRKLRLARNV